jgi:signal transduction histidine kinase
MEAAGQLISPRVVLGRAEQRLSQLSGEIQEAGAQYCVILDDQGVHVAGLIRFSDVVAKTETSTRILSDLMKRPCLESVRETDPPERVQLIFERGGPQEVVVTAADFPAFVGLITPESFSVWLLRNEQLRKAELERLLQEQKRLADFLEKKVAAQLGEVRETLNEFGALCVSLAHDIRQPLRTIQAFSDLLAGGEGGDLNAQGRNAVERIAKVAGRAETLAEDILDKARASFGDRSRTLATIDLNAVFADALEFLDAEIRGRQAQVRTEGALGAITGYYVPVLQVFINLLVNALKYVSPEKSPVVVVWTEETEREVTLYVRDNGVGMSQEHRAVVSAPALDHYGAGPAGGGHGLKITRNAVGILGGRVTAAPETGGGTLFIVTLPRAGVCAG